MDFLGKRLSTEEAPEEVPTVSEESFLELKCNIGVGTNYLLQGISEVCSFFSCFVLEGRLELIRGGSLGTRSKY